MNLFESFRIAILSLIANKLRSVLTMLGIIIGVGAVIVMVSIGQGASAQVTNSIQGLGSNLLFIQGGQAVAGGVAQGLGSSASLTQADAAALTKLDAVGGVAPINGRNAQIVYQGKNTSTQVTGTSPSFVNVRNWPVQTGRFFTDDEETSGAKVATIGTTTATNLFGDAGADAIGKLIKINNIPFRIIGVMQSKGSSGYSDQDDAVYIPLSTFQHRFVGGRDRDNIRTIYVEAKTADQTQQAIDEITTTLRRTHHLASNQPANFQVRNQADILASAQSTTQTLTYLLGGVAAISLLVGGIGIMNIMLVSVTERTREIGIRKAIGAKERDLLFQFLIESISLAVLGGAIGIALGYIGSGNIGKLMNAPTQVSIHTVFLAFAFSAAIGIIFGVVPARKAAKLDPIEALRYE